MPDFLLKVVESFLLKTLDISFAVCYNIIVDMEYEIQAGVHRDGKYNYAEEGY